MGKWVSGLAVGLQNQLERFDSAFALDVKKAIISVVSVFIGLYF